MLNDACPLPSPSSRSEREVIERLLKLKRIAVVGASDDEMRPGHYVPAYMIDHGYEIIPVNPNHQTVFGKTCFAKLADIPGGFELVNVFRRPIACADVTRQAIAAGAKGIWLQSGITNAEAKKLAAEAGVDYIENRCMMMEHSRRR